MAVAFKQRYVLSSFLLMCSQPPSLFVSLVSQRSTRIKTAQNTPSFIFLQLARFTWNQAGSYLKDRTQVRLKEEVTVHKRVYRPRAIVCHRGSSSPQHGHYDCLFRNPHHGIWYCADDGTVSEMSWEDVVTRTVCDAYLVVLARE